MPIDGLFAEVVGTFLQISGLEPNTAYICEVSAVNAVGEGLKSDPLSITTLVGPPLQFFLTISATPGGTTDPAPSTYTFDAGTVAVVAAIPAAGWAFDHWEGDVSGTENPVSFLITADMLITAVFSEVIVPPEEFALTISALEGGITDPAPGPYTYLEGTLVTVTAIPSSGWKFDHWEGDVTGSNPEITVDMLQNLSIVAVFSEKAGWSPWVAGGLALLGLVGVVLVGRKSKIKRR